MRILFIAEPYMNLHLPIIKELEEQGHNVVYIQDKHLNFDWKESWRGKIDRTVRRVKAFVNRSYQKYWDYQFSLHKDLEIPFDLLLVINGCSFDSYLLERLRKISPNIKTVLYLWDNSAFYDYFHNANFFDKVMTYDMDDAKKFHAGLLPFFYTKEMGQTTDVPKYLISTVGTNHSGRLELCRKIFKDKTSKFNNRYEDVQQQFAPVVSLWNVDGGILYFRIIDTSIPEDEIVSHKKMPLSELTQLMKK